MNPVEDSVKSFKKGVQSSIKGGGVTISSGQFYGPGLKDIANPQVTNRVKRKGGPAERVPPGQSSVHRGNPKKLRKPQETLT